MPASLASAESPPRIAIVGAGISGLAAAYEVTEKCPEAKLTVFESASSPGGILQTVRRDGFLIERAADNFLTKLPWATDLCHEIGLEGKLLRTDEARRRALVVHQGQVKPVPDAFVIMAPHSLRGVMRSPVLSLAGKLRVCLEPFVPRRRGSSDESVASFARRRLGREAFERIVQPLLGGIYTADPEKLSMAATMPHYVEQEQEHGSLYRAARRQNRSAGNDEDNVQASNTDSGARYSLFVAPEEGVSQMVEKLASKLPTAAVHLDTGVSSVERNGNQWKVETVGQETSGTYDGVIVTTPAYHAAELLSESLSELAAELSEIEYAGSSVVCLGFRRDQIAADISGFGFVVPAIEKRKLIAVSFASLKFSGRAPAGHILLRAFIGGALQPELAELGNEELRRLATDELADLLQISGEPVIAEIARWPRAMPQYHVGHLDRVQRIESLVEQASGFELAGAAYRGVGIPQCIRSGRTAAQRLIAGLRS